MLLPSERRDWSIRLQSSRSQRLGHFHHYLWMHILRCSPAIWMAVTPAVCPDKPSRYSDTCASLRNRTVREDYLLLLLLFFFVGPLNFRGYRGIIGSFTSTQTSILKAEDGLQCWVSKDFIADLNKKHLKDLNWQDYELYRVLSYLEGRCQRKL